MGLQARDMGRKVSLASYSSNIAHDDSQNIYPHPRQVRSTHLRLCRPACRPQLALTPTTRRRRPGETSSTVPYPEEQTKAPPRGICGPPMWRLSRRRPTNAQKSRKPPPQCGRACRAQRHARFPTYSGVCIRHVQYITCGIRYSDKIYIESGAMATWAPDLYAYYGEKLDALHQNDFSLHRTFPSSIFSATTYNFGPRTVCFRHKDFANLAFGFCSVTALGNFDPTKGGHLVLWELGLVIEFPPGSTILLTSALISHSNTTIAANETRYSVAQYSAGALFRWVDNGFQRSQDLYEPLPPWERETLEFLDTFNWDYGLSKLPVYPVPTSAT